MKTYYDTDGFYYLTNSGTKIYYVDYPSVPISLTNEETAARLAYINKIVDEKIGE